MHTSMLVLYLFTVRMLCLTASGKIAKIFSWYVNYTPQHSSIAFLYVTLLFTYTQLSYLCICSQQLVALQCMHIFKQLCWGFYTKVPHVFSDHTISVFTKINSRQEDKIKCTMYGIFLKVEVKWLRAPCNMKPYNLWCN